MTPSLSNLAAPPASCRACCCSCCCACCWLGSGGWACCWACCWASATPALAKIRATTTETNNHVFFLRITLLHYARHLQLRGTASPSFLLPLELKRVDSTVC